MFEQVKEILIDKFGDREITEETSFVDDLNADSLDLVDLVMELEDKIGVAISDEELPNLKTVGDIVKYIEDNK